MTSSELRVDAVTVLAVLTSPRRGLDLVVEHRRSFVAILVATLASLICAAAVVPRLDFAKAGSRALELSPAAAEMTPFQREEAVEQVRNVGTVGFYASSAFMPALSVLVAAFFLWLAFKVAGTTPQFRGTLAIVAFGLLPGTLSELLAIPAVIQQAPVDPEAMGTLIPSSLAALMPSGTSSVGMALASSFDFFSIWTLGLLTLGMTKLCGASLRRSGVVVGVLWIAYMAIKVAGAAATRAAGG